MGGRRRIQPVNPPHDLPKGGLSRKGGQSDGGVGEGQSLQVRGIDKTGGLLNNNASAEGRVDGAVGGVDTSSTRSRERGVQGGYTRKEGEW